MTQNSRKLGVKDTYIKLIPKYTYFMHKLHRAVNHFLPVVRRLKWKRKNILPKLIVFRHCCLPSKL